MVLPVVGPPGRRGSKVTGRPAIGSKPVETKGSVEVELVGLGRRLRLFGVRRDPRSFQGQFGPLVPDKPDR